MKLFKAVKKQPDEFAAGVLPWKATNGVVCTDHYTEAEAIEAAKRINRERKRQCLK